MLVLARAIKLDGMMGLLGKLAAILGANRTVVTGISAAPEPRLPRLTQQIIRNSIADNVGSVRPEAALVWGLDEYFEMWEAAFPNVELGRFTLHPNSALDEAERIALERLVDVLNQASKATDGMTAEAFLQSAWPGQIEGAAQPAFATMRARGRFSEDHEEGDPSLPF